MNKINRFFSVEVVLALLLIIAYFLPWADLGVVKFTGWEIPKLQKTMTQVTNFFSRNKSSVYTAYAIFLIPILSTLVIASWIMLKRQISRVLLFITSLIGIPLSVYLFFNLPKHGSTGMYLLGLSSLISVIYFVQLRKKKNRADEKSVVENITTT